MPVVTVGSSALVTLDTAPSATIGATGLVALGTVTNATAGVAVVRGGQRMLVDGSHALQAGDHVTVPEGGHATVNFPESATNKSALSGRLTGGSDAIVVSTKLPGGMEDVDVDLMSGDLLMESPYAVAEEAVPPVKETVAAAAEEVGLNPFALGALGVLAVGAALVALSSSENSDSSVSTVATNTSQSTSTPAPAVHKSTPAQTGASDSAVGTEPSHAAGQDTTFNSGKSKSTSRTNGADAANGAFLASGPSGSEEANNHGATSHDGNAHSLNDSTLYSGGSGPFDFASSAFGAMADKVSGFLTPGIDNFLGAGVIAGLADALEPQIDSLTGGASTLLPTHAITLLPAMMDGEVLGGTLFTLETGLFHGDLLNAPLLTTGAEQLSGAPLVPVVESLGGGFFDAAPTSPVTSLVAGDSTTSHLIEPASGLLGSSAALIGGGAVSSAVSSTSPIAATAPAIDMLHVGLITPITSTVESGSATGLQSPASHHVLHGLLA